MNLLDFILMVDSSDEIREAIEQKKVIAVRHAMSHRSDGNWSEFDEMLRFDDNLINVFTAEQPSDYFKESKFIFVFVKTEGTKCVLRAVFRNQGLVSKTDFVKVNPSYLAYLDFRERNKIAVSVNRVYYNFMERETFRSLCNRLVIDWGSATQRWYQRILDKPVVQLLPEGFLEPFPGWENVNVSHVFLKALIAAPAGNPDWFKFLSEHDGVYVIRDTSSGKLYVGSAYSGSETGGIWGRWSGYAKSGTNGNKGLVELVKDDPAYPENFFYSLHHVVPRGSSSAKQVLRLEGLLKEKLGARSIEHGLCRN